MSGWTRDHPGIGDMGVIRGFATRMSARSTELQELISDVRTASSQGTGASVFTGSAATAWAERAPGLQATIGTIVDVLDGRYRAAETYVNEVENIRHSVNVVWEERGAALRGLAAWQQASPDFQSSVTGAHLKDGLDARLHETHRSLEHLSDQRAAADHAFAAALHAEVTVDGWDSSAIMGIVGGFPQYGAPSIEDIERAEALAAATRISSDEAGLTWEEDWRLIDDYLKAHANDPEALSRFYRALGGAGVEKLTYASVLMDNGSDYALRIQSTFAAASFEWTDAQAEAMADDLVAACGGYGGRVSVLGFLLHGGASDGEDYPLVSAAAAKAFATAVYDLEIAGDDGNPMWTMDSVSDAFYRWYIDNVLTPEGDYSVSGSPMEGLYDATGDVVLTLAAYPDDALAWVYDGGNVDHTEWMFTRDWADGYEAPTGLLLTIQDATDGVNSADFVGNTAAIRHTVEITASALTYLTMGDSATRPDLLSETAATYLATGLGDLSPYFSETLEYRMDGKGLPPVSESWVVRDGVGELVTIPVPDVTTGVYVQAVRLFSDSAVAMTVFDNAVTNYQADVLAMMGERPGVALEMTDGLHQVSGIRAVVDEVIATRTVQLAEDSARVQGLAVDGGSLVIGKVAQIVISVGSDGTASVPAKYIGGFVTDGLGVVGHDLVDQHLKQTIDQRIESLFNGADDFESYLERVMNDAPNGWTDTLPDGSRHVATAGEVGPLSAAAADYAEARSSVKELMDPEFAQSQWDH